jgi:hypothetical protein
VSVQETPAVPAAVSPRHTARGALIRVLEREGTLVMVLGAFVIVLIAALRGSLVIDGYMALVSGREVAHGLPSHDALAVMTQGHSWVDQQWLAQLVLYGLARLGGVKLVLLIGAALAAGAFAAAAILARRLGASPRAVTWVCLPAIVAYYPEASVLRPQSLAYPLFVATFWLLVSDTRSPSRRVFLTLPILLVWANLHGSVLVGAGLVALRGLAYAWERKAVSGRAAALVVAPWLCVFASPYAPDLPRYYDTVLRGGNFGHFVSEWAPMTLTAATAAVYLLILGGIWLLGRVRGRSSVFEALAFVVLCLLAFQAVRNAAWIGLAAVIVLPALVDAVRRPADEPARINRLLASVMLAGVAVAIVGVAANPTTWFTADYPRVASAAATAAAGPDGTVYATSRYADWLLWSEPRLRGRVAFDARFELLTHAQVSAISRLQATAGDWRRTLRPYRVVVLDRRDDRALRSALVRSGMRVVSQSGDVVVLRRPR